MQGSGAGAGVGAGAGAAGGALRRQQRRFEGAGAAALTRREHLTGEMVKSVVSFWGETDPSVRRCAHTLHRQTLCRGRSLFTAVIVLTYEPFFTSDFSFTVVLFSVASPHRGT